MNDDTLLNGDSEDEDAKEEDTDVSKEDEDLNKPTFMRHELVDKFTFRRLSDQPIAVLEVQY